MFHEQLRVLEERAMRGVGVEDQLRVRQVLLQIERVDGVEDDVGFAADDQDRHFDVLEIGETFAGGFAPFLESGELRGLNLLIDGRVAIFYACVPALEEGASGSLTRGRRGEEAIDPEVIQIAVFVGEDDLRLRRC